MAKKSVSLSVSSPELAAEWHPELNSPLRPEQVSSGSNKSVWWLGKCGHTWSTRVYARTRNKSGCPYCANRAVLKGFNDLETINPKLAREWHLSKNLRSASEVQAGSKRKAWWQCDKGHEWESQIDSRNRLEAGCPFCSGRRPVAGLNDLATTWPSVISQWHPTKNAGLSPESLTATSEKKVWWICAKGHEWRSAPVTRGEKCPICQNRKLLPGFNDFETIEPELVRELHPTKNENFSAREILAGSEKKVWWICPKGHEWETGLHVRRMGRGCPVCSNNIVQVGINDLATTNPSMAAEWHPFKNGVLMPTDVVAGTSRHIWWICSEGHEWETTGNYRQIDDSGCPSCAVRGFNPSEPALVYFIQHDELAARKVGITNSNNRNDRIAGFKNKGWTIIKIWSFGEGNSPKTIEREFFQWLRKVHQLPKFLGQEEMGALSGYTETFSKEGPINQEVINFIESQIERL